VTQVTTATIFVDINYEAYTTSTLTKQVPVATHYAACDSSNQLQHIDSTNDVASSNFENYPNDILIAPSAYDCCVAAIEGGYAFSAYGINNLYDPCRLFIAKDQGATCAFNGTEESFYVTPDKPQVNPYVLSNGYCGSWVYAG
jgi:hypothetical protein